MISYLDEHIGRQDSVHAGICGFIFLACLCSTSSLSLPVFLMSLLHFHFLSRSVSSSQTSLCASTSMEIWAMSKKLSSVVCSKLLGLLTVACVCREWSIINDRVSHRETETPSRSRSRLKGRRQKQAPADTDWGVNDQMVKDILFTSWELLAPT